MKTIKTLVIALMAVGMLAGCSQVGNVTKLNGTIIEGEDFEEVNVFVEKYDIDTLVPVVKGKFHIDLPVDPTEVAFVFAGYYEEYLILDGTRLTVTLGENDTKVTSKSKKSIQNRLNEFIDGLAAMDSEFEEAYLALQQEGLSEEEVRVCVEEILEAMAERQVEYTESVILDNRDNAVGGVAVSSLDGFVDDEKLSVLLGTLSEEVQESSIIAPLFHVVETRLATAEGQPFVDFAVEDSDGKTVSLSDYVGKGKYVLVDFWASWCGPCKEETPNIKAAYDKYRRKGFDVVSVAVADDPADSKAAAKELGMTWNLIINAGQIPAEVYGFSTIPQIMLFGPDGTILKKGLRGEDISEEIAKHIQ